MSAIPATLRDLEVPVEDLKPYPRNPRRGDVSVIVESLERNGQYRPVVVNKRTMEVLAGNHTLAAARQLGWESLAATFVDVDDEAAARIALVDNRASDLAGYDDRALVDLLQDLDDIGGTGYTTDDLDDLLASLDPADDGPAVTDPSEPPADPRTRPGDIWTLGGHRIVCGDARDPDVVARLIGGASVNVAFTSPPYADRRKYDEASGFVPIAPDDYVEWFDAVQANVSNHIADDGSWFVNIKASVTPDGLDTELYVIDLVLAHVRRWGWHFATEFCWERNGVPKSVTRRFKNQFEPIYQFTRGDWKMRPDAVRHESENVPKAGGPGSGNTNWAGTQGGPTNSANFGVVNKRKNGGRGGWGGMDEEDAQGTNWQPGEVIGPGLAYPGNRLPTFISSHEATGHVAAFPVGLPEFFIRAYTDAGDTVYDPFMGSGSTLLAAENTGRIGYGAEISPGYCDVIVDRWERHTGLQAVKLDAGV